MAQRILVVDDDRVIQELLAVNLEMEGYDVVTAGNGEQALALIAERAPDLVILDVMMPKLDGWATASRMKADTSIADIPVMFLTARTQDLDVKRGVELGVAAYITKPFDPIELLDKVRRVLEGERILPAE